MRIFRVSYTRTMRPIWTRALPVTGVIALLLAPGMGIVADQAAQPETSQTAPEPVSVDRAERDEIIRNELQAVVDRVHAKRS